MTVAMNPAGQASPPFVGLPLDRDLASRPDLPLRHQWRLAASASRWVRTTLAANPSLHPQVQRLLLAGYSTAAIVAGNPGLASDLQHQIWSSEDEELHAPLAANPAIDTALQRAVFHHGVYLDELAENPALSPDLHADLARDRNPEVRVRLAANPRLTPSLLNMLARDADPWVRGGAARNPRLSQADQARLSRDAAESVRKALAGNPAADPEVQLVLAGDPQDGVKEALARNPALAEAACARLVGTGRLLVLSSLAGNGALVHRWQAVLAHCAQVRPILMRHGQLAPDVQRTLAQIDRGYLQVLARNPAVIPELQLRLAVDRNPYVRAALMANPSLTREALRVLLLALVRQRDPEDPLRKSLKHVRALGSGTYWVPESLNHPILGPMVAARTGKHSIQLAAASHSDVLVRLGLAANLQLKAEALRVILADPDADVRAGATEHAMKGLAMFG